MSKTLSREERAQRLFESAKLEIKYIRDLDASLQKEGKKLNSYLKEQAVFIARFLVHKGIQFRTTTERVKIRSDLRPW